MCTEYPGYALQPNIAERRAKKPGSGFFVGLGLAFDAFMVVVESFWTEATAFCTAFSEAWGFVVFDTFATAATAFVSADVVAFGLLLAVVAVVAFAIVDAAFSTFCSVVFAGGFGFGALGSAATAGFAVAVGSGGSSGTAFTANVSMSASTHVKRIAFLCAGAAGVRVGGEGERGCVLGRQIHQIGRGNVGGRR